MSGKKDIVKVRVEEATGALIGNDELHNKGRADLAFGHVKELPKKVIAKGSRRRHS